MPVVPFQKHDKAVYWGNDPRMPHRVELTVVETSTDRERTLVVSAPNGETITMSYLASCMMKRPRRYYPAGADGLALAVSELTYFAVPMDAVADPSKDGAYYLRDAEGHFHWFDPDRSDICAVAPNIAADLFSRAEETFNVGAPMADGCAHEDLTSAFRL